MQFPVPSRKLLALRLPRGTSQQDWGVVQRTARDSRGATDEGIMLE